MWKSSRPLPDVEKLVLGSARPAEAQSTEPEDALEMSEEHLDLLSFAT
jgi:hypothetical protein